MRPHDPWIADLRSTSLKKVVSRIGLPAIPDYRMTSYSKFIRKLILLLTLFCGGITIAYVYITGVWHPTPNYVTLDTLDPGGSHANQIKSSKKKGLIIVTNHRSGSTFLGQFFNQRSDVFYIFEPLVTFDEKCSYSEKKKTRHLHDLLKCKIRDQPLVFADAGRPIDQEKIKGLGQKCIPNNFCFREKSKALCAGQFCTTGNNVTCSRCGPVNSAMASSKCAESSLVVIKVIRLCHVNNLKSILEDSNIDVKVIHLMRDPRGVLSSRLRVQEGTSRMTLQGVVKMCDRNLENVKFARGQPDWLRNKYKIIRYEDICQFPLKFAEKIYKFVGLGMTSTMKRWIYANTKGSLRNMGDIRGFKVFKTLIRKEKKALKRLPRAQQSVEHVKRKALKQAILHDPYTTTRNSSATWRQWIAKLNFNEISFAQAKCSDVMNELRYLSVNETQFTERTPPFIGTLCSQFNFNLC
ncbi:unnamed protein product [Clavelina lepadiformis]|uniref:Sulfotransferase n=1 Tax=Clavelina lepadiformis TaxID=159417 RepID=A0ABP0G2R3_CLALP